MSRFLIAVALWAFAGQLLAAEPAEKITHSFLVAGHRTAILDNSGKVLWSYPHPSRDGYVLPSGNVLLALGKSQKYPGGAVVEVTRDGKTVFEYVGTQAEVNSAQLLANGNIVLTEAGPKPRLLEITRDGKTVVEFPLACQKPNTHMQTRMTRQLASGNYLAPHLLDFAVKEYDPQGKVVRTLPTDLNGRQVHDWPFTAIRLPNGNTLIGCTHGAKVIELDPNGKLVWQVSNDDLDGDPIQDACGVQRLPNGNTVIASYAAKNGPKLLEVTPEKKVVWTFHGDGPGVHHFQILDTNGAPLAGEPLK